MTEYLQYDKLQYLVRYPKEYMEGMKYPIIILLHGAGKRGNNICEMSAHPFFTITEKKSSFPFITVAPQCSKDTWFDMFETLQHLVREVASKPYADEKRIYLIGISMGGYAAWQLAMSIPEYFAAVCPICGGGMYWNAGRLVNVPVWAFHGAKDETVLVDESRKMVDAVNRCGGSARLTVYPENGHDAWTDTFHKPEVFDWLLSLKK